MLGKQCLALLDPILIRILKFEPPIVFHLGQGCRLLATCTNWRHATLTHGLMVRPSEWSVRSGKSFRDIEAMVWAGKWNSTECGVVRKVPQRLDLFDRELARSEHRVICTQVRGFHWQDLVTPALHRSRRLFRESIQAHLYARRDKSCASRWWEHVGVVLVLTG
jgi:hypothetical protein